MASDMVSFDEPNRYGILLDNIYSGKQAFHAEKLNTVAIQFEWPRKTQYLKYGRPPLRSRDNAQLPPEKHYSFTPFTNHLKKSENQPNRPMIDR